MVCFGFPATVVATSEAADDSPIVDAGGDPLNIMIPSCSSSYCTRLLSCRSMLSPAQSRSVSDSVTVCSSSPAFDSSTQACSTTAGEVLSTASSLLEQSSYIVGLAKQSPSLSESRGLAAVVLRGLATTTF